MRDQLKLSAALAAACLVFASFPTPAAAGSEDDTAALVDTATTFAAGARAAVIAGATEAMNPKARDSRWKWPLDAPTLKARFDPPDHRYGAGHRGIDISGSSTSVTAVEGGTVHFAGSVAGKPVVSIMHRDGLLSTYEPVAAAVSKGDTVSAGDVIGTLQANSAHAHCAGCLHLGARRGDSYIDPLPLLGARGPSVLYPRR